MDAESLARLVALSERVRLPYSLGNGHVDEDHDHLHNADGSPVALIECGEERDDTYTGNEDALYILTAANMAPALARELAEARSEVERLRERATFDAAVIARGVVKCADYVALMMEAADNLANLIEGMGEECRFDHHGACQAHFVEDPCSVGEAVSLQARLRAAAGGGGA